MSLPLFIVLVSFNGFNDLAKKEISFPWENGMILVGIRILFILFTSLLAGSYPALYLSSFKPVDVLKGTFKSVNMPVFPEKYWWWYNSRFPLFLL